MNTQYLGNRLVSSEMANGRRAFTKRSGATAVESREFVGGKTAVAASMALLSSLFVAWASMALLILITAV